MYNVLLSGSKTFDSQILMHSWAPKNDVSLAKGLQKYLSKEHHKHGFIEKGKYREIFIERKCTDRKYHVQDNANFSHKDVKIYCDINQFPKLLFSG